MKDFTAQQKEIVARKLGYDGPMQGFDEFIASSPALEAKYSAITGKYVERMAKGGLVKTKRKYRVGGDLNAKYQIDGQEGMGVGLPSSGDKTLPDDNLPSSTPPTTPAVPSSDGKKLTDDDLPTLNPPTTSAPAAPAKEPTYEEMLAMGYGDGGMDEEGKTVWIGGGNRTTPTAPTTSATPTTSAPSTTGSSTPAVTPTAPAPVAGEASQVTAAQITPTDAQKISTESRAGETATQVTGAATATAGQATATQTGPAATYEASKAAPAIGEALAGVTAATGEVSKEAQVVAAQAGPTALTGAADRAAQITEAQTVKAPEDRKLEEGEKVSGSAVDMAKVDKELAQAKAAEGTVTEEMTVQGQLTKLTKDFDTKNPPPWAAGALRAVAAEMGARGLGASSMAGAALVQAALEKALPIASADAAIFQQVATQNLSNRQQVAMLTAQQRAAFLGQEFDQNFQSRVINASKISDIANMNFNAKQQVALENSRLAQSVDLANLNSKQAAFMAELAQTATLETANLSNRQQASVANAQAFLAMDMKNLDNTQQTILFKAQATTQALLSDTASANASKQFNAASENQVTQFNATMATQVSQFNAAQTTAVSQFNTDQTNSVAKFNAEAQNQRQSFNASQRLVIDQSNAQWQREISTANTAATNAANSLNAQLSQNMTLAEYNNQTQLYRDSVSFAWQEGQNDEDRANKLAISEIQADATRNAGVAAEKTKAKGNLIGTAAKAAAMFFLSDERMKDIQGPITNALDKIKEIGGYSYTYKVEAEPFGYNSTITTMGVLSGQVKRVLPEAVKPASFNSTFDVVDYAAVNGLLVAAVNELITKVDLLSTRLNELEKK
jgi:hypothetical protein